MLRVVAVALRPVGKVAERVLRNAEAKRRTRKAAATRAMRSMPIERWLATLPDEVCDRIVAVLEDAWRGLRPQRTLPQQIRRYYRGTAALPPVPFHVEERATRAARTADFEARWAMTCRRLAESDARDRHHPRPSMPERTFLDSDLMRSPVSNPLGVERWPPPPAAPLRPT